MFSTSDTIRETLSRALFLALLATTCFSQNTVVTTLAFSTICIWFFAAQGLSRLAALCWMMYHYIKANQSVTSLEDRLNQAFFHRPWHTSHIATIQLAVLQTNIIKQGYLLSGITILGTVALLISSDLSTTHPQIFGTTVIWLICFCASALADCYIVYTLQKQNKSKAQILTELETQTGNMIKIIHLARNPESPDPSVSNLIGMPIPKPSFDADTKALKIGYWFGALHKLEFLATNLTKLQAIARKA